MDTEADVLEQVTPTLRLVTQAQRQYYVFTPNPRTPERHFFQPDGFIPSHLRAKIKKYERHKSERAASL